MNEEINKQKIKFGIKNSGDLGEHPMPPPNLGWFPYVETYYGNVNHKHNPWWKFLCNLILRPLRIKIVSIFKDDVNNIVDYKIRRI